MTLRYIRMIALVFALFVVGCAGLERGCSSCMAQEFGSDWVIVELREADGTPYRCWVLRGVSVSNETSSDGIYWKDNNGNLVHVSGSYDRVQVRMGKWNEAFDTLNLTQDECRKVRESRYDAKSGRYVTPER